MLLWLISLFKTRRGGMGWRSAFYGSMISLCFLVFLSAFYTRT